MTISPGLTGVLRLGNPSRPWPRRPNCYWPERATSLSSSLSKRRLTSSRGCPVCPAEQKLGATERLRATECRSASRDSAFVAAIASRKRFGSVEFITHLRCAAGPFIRIKTKGISQPGLARQLNARRPRLSSFARRNCDDDLNATDQASGQRLAQQCSPATSPLGFLPSVVNRCSQVLTESFHDNRHLPPL